MINLVQVESLVIHLCSVTVLDLTEQTSPCFNRNHPIRLPFCIQQDMTLQTNLNFADTVFNEYL